VTASIRSAMCSERQTRDRYGVRLQLIHDPGRTTHAGGIDAFHSRVNQPARTSRARIG
jgi:hypothetical protein